MTLIVAVLLTIAAQTCITCAVLLDSLSYAGIAACLVIFLFIWIFRAKDL